MPDRGGLGVDVDNLIQYLSHTSAEVRERAAVALGKLKDERAVEPLIELLADDDRCVRNKAAVALGEMGTTAVEPLIELLKDENREVREAAELALRIIKKKIR